jgi:hypothetical protein
MRRPAPGLQAVVRAIALCVLAAGQSIFGQFRPEETAQRENWEEFLVTADIVKAEQVGEGVTKPWRLYLKKGETEHTAAWKNVESKSGGIVDNWQHEIAAYRIDKLIGLNMIPVTVEREFKGKKGSLSLWAESKYSLLKIMEDGIEMPESVFTQTDDMKYIARLFDSLIANDDRTQQNFLFTADWRTILVDHSRAFQSSRKYTIKLVNGMKGIKETEEGKPYLIRRVPRALLEKIKAMTLESVRQAVGPYLTDKESEAVVARKALVLAEIAEMIKQNGEEKVLY